MRSWASLTVLCTLSAVVLIQASPRLIVDPPPNEVGFREGVLYQYAYSTNITVGFPVVKRDAAAVRITGLTYVVGLKKNKILLYFDGAQCSQSQTKGNDVEIRTCEGLERLLENLLIPIYGTYYHGAISKIIVHDKDHRESINFKKHLMSQLQVQLNMGTSEEPDEFEVYEDGTGGNCKTVYRHNEYKDQSEEQLYKIVDKIRRYDDCQSRVQYYSDNFEGCDCTHRHHESTSPTRCACGQNRTSNLEESFAVSRYNISLKTVPLQLDAIETTAKTVLLGHTKELAATVTTRFVLQKTWDKEEQEPNALEYEKSLQPALWDVKEDTDDEIEYFKIWNIYPKENIIDQIVEDIKLVSEKIETGLVNVTELVGNTTLKIMDGIATLTTDELKTLFDRIVSSQKIGFERELFLQTLPLSGSSKVAKLIRDLVVDGSVSVSEARELVEAVPENIYNATEEVVTAYSELCQHPKVKEDKRLFASVCLAYGKLLRAHCRSSGKKLSRQSHGHDSRDIKYFKDESRDIKYFKNAKHVAGNEMFEDSYGSTEFERSSAAESRRYARPQVTDDEVFEDGYRITKRVKSTSQKFHFDDKERCMREEFAVEQLKIVASLLKNAQTFNERVVYLTTLGQMGMEDGFPLFEPYINREICQEKQIEESECNILQRVALNNLHKIHFDKYYHKFQAIIFSIFHNVSETDHLRIVAFSLILEKTVPSSQLFDEIVLRVQNETSRQVKGFVMTSLQDLASSSLSHRQLKAKLAKRSLARLPNHVIDMKDSYSVTSDWFDKLKELGAYLTLKNARNQTGGVIEGEFLNVQYIADKLANNLLWIAFDSEGLAKSLEELPYLRQFKPLKPHPRFRKFGRQNDIIKMLNSMEDFKMIFYSEIFHMTTLSTWEKEDVVQALKLVERLLESFADPSQKEHRLFKMYMPVTYKKVVALEMGAPLRMSWRTPLIWTLRVRPLSWQNISPEGCQGRRCNVSAWIQPSLYYSSIRSMHVLFPSDAYPEPDQRTQMGAEIENRVHFSLPANISVDTCMEEQMTGVSIKFEPAMNRDLYIHKQEGKSSFYSPKKGLDIGAVHVLQEPLRFNATFEQSFGGLNVTFNSTGEDLHAMEPLYAFEAAKSRSIPAALIEKYLHPECWNDKEGLLADLWNLLHPDYFNNQFTVGLWDNTDTWTRGYLLNLKYHRTVLNPNKGKFEDEPVEGKKPIWWTVEEYESSARSLLEETIELPGERSKTLGEFGDELIAESIKSLSNVQAESEKQELQNLYQSSIRYMWNITLTTLGPKPVARRDVIHTVHSLDYSHNLISVWSYSNETVPSGDMKPKGCLRGFLLVPAVGSSGQYGFFYLVYGEGPDPRICLCPEECVDTNLVIKAIVKMDEAFSVPSVVDNGVNCLRAAALGKRQPQSCFMCLLNETTIEEFDALIDYDDIPEHIVNTTRRSEMCLIKKLYPSEMDIRVKDSPSRKHGRITVHGTAQQIVPYVPEFDMVIEKPSERIVIQHREIDDPQDQNCLEPPYKKQLYRNRA